MHCLESTLGWPPSFNMPCPCHDCRSSMVGKSQGAWNSAAEVYTSALAHGTHAFVSYTCTRAYLRRGVPSADSLRQGVAYDQPLVFQQTLLHDAGTTMLGQLWPSWPLVDPSWALPRASLLEKLVLHLHGQTQHSNTHIYKLPLSSPQCHALNLSSAYIGPPLLSTWQESWCFHIFMLRLSIAKLTPASFVKPLAFYNPWFHDTCCHSLPPQDHSPRRRSQRSI